MIPYIPIMARLRSRNWGNPGDTFYLDDNLIWQSVPRPDDWATVPYFWGIDQTTGFPAWLALSGVVTYIVRGAFIGPTVQIFAPTVTRVVTVPSIASTVTLYPPSVTVGLAIVGGTIASGNQLFAPTVLAEQAVTGGTISSTQLFGPTVASLQEVTGGTISGTQLFSPTVTPIESFSSLNGSFSAPTSGGGTVTLTFPFEVKFLMLHGNSKTTTSGTDATAENLKLGLGWATGTSSRRAITVQADHNAGTSATDRKHSDTCCYMLLNIDGTDWGQLDVDLWSWNGIEHTIRLIADSAFLAANRVFYWALGGSDVSASLSTHQEPGATGNQDITVGVSAANLFLFMGANQTAAPTGTHASDTAAGSLMFFGAADAAAGQGVWCGGSEDAQGTSDCSGYQKSGQCIAMMPGDPNSLDARAAFTSVSGTTVSLNWAERAATRYFFCAAIKVPNAKVGNVSKTAGTGTFTQTTSFNPEAGLVFSRGNVENTDDTPAGNYAVSFGHWANDQHTTCGTWSVREIDNQGTTDMTDQSIKVNTHVHYFSFGVSAAQSVEVQSRSGTGVVYNADDGLSNTSIFTSILVGS